MHRVDIDGRKYNVVKGSYTAPYREKLYSEVQVLNRLGNTGKSNVVLQDDGFGLEYVEFDLYVDYDGYKSLSRKRDNKSKVDLIMYNMNGRIVGKGLLLYDVGPLEVFGADTYICPIKVLVG